MSIVFGNGMNGSRDVLRTAQEDSNLFLRKGENVVATEFITNTADPDGSGNVIPSFVIETPAGLNRWSIGVKNEEQGDNIGNDLVISSYADDGTPLDIPIFVKRQTGEVDLTSVLVVGGSNGGYTSIDGSLSHATTISQVATGTGTGNNVVICKQTLGALGNSIVPPGQCATRVVDTLGTEHNAITISCDGALAGFPAGCVYLQGGVENSASISGTPYDGDGALISPVPPLADGGVVLATIGAPADIYKSSRILINLNVENNNTDGANNADLYYGVYFSIGGAVVPADVLQVGFSIGTPANATTRWSGTVVARAGEDYTQGGDYVGIQIIAYSNPGFPNSRMDNWSLNYSACTVL